MFTHDVIVYTLCIAVYWWTIMMSLDARPHLLEPGHGAGVIHSS